MKNKKVTWLVAAEICLLALLAAVIALLALKPEILRQPEATDPTVITTAAPTTEATTQPTTEATTQATTEPVTEPATEPSTEPVGCGGLAKCLGQNPNVVRGIVALLGLLSCGTFVLYYLLIWVLSSKKIV